MNKIKTILMGTPEFAERVFKKSYPALKDKFEIIAVITAPILSPVKKWALESNFKVLQPDKIRELEWIKKIQELAPELIILCAYGQIIPKEILDIPKYGALNIHPSLLPKYRGASPIHAAILNGDTETGVTLMLMDEEMDHGDIISNFKFQISKPKITYKELEDKLVDVAAGLLIKTLPDWVEGKIRPKPQDHSKATFCKIIKKQDGKIDWNKSAEKIEKQVRAFYPWPGSFTYFNNKQLKILQADLEQNEIEECASCPTRQLCETSKKTGEVFLTDNKGLAVQTGNGILILKQVQLEGKKPMPGSSFLHGHSDIVGSNLQ